MIMIMKGGKTEGFIAKLDVKKIMKTYCRSFKSLCESLELDCRIICKKQ